MLAAARDLEEMQQGGAAVATAEAEEGVEQQQDDREGHGPPCTAAAATVADPSAAAPSAVVTKVVLVMLHDTGLSNAAVWDAWIAQLPPSIAVAFHLCAGAAPPAGPAALPGGAVFAPRLLPTSLPAEWGQPSLFVATVACARVLLERHPRATHVMIASGTHLPLRSDPFDSPLVTEGVSWVPWMTPLPELARIVAREALAELRLEEGLVSVMLKLL